MARANRPQPTCELLSEIWKFLLPQGVSDWPASNGQEEAQEEEEKEYKEKVRFKNNIIQFGGGLGGMSKVKKNPQKKIIGLKIIFWRDKNYFLGGGCF